jgi:hypothetical protein
MFLIVSAWVNNMLRVLNAERILWNRELYFFLSAPDHAINPLEFRIIADKFFHQLDSNGRSCLEWSHTHWLALTQWKWQSYSLFHVLINIHYRYDFDNDGFITREDCRFVLSYLPLSFLQNLATRQSRISMQRTTGPSGFGARSHSQSNSGSKYASLDDTYERVQLNT